MEIEFVVGEWSRKSSFLFVSVGTVSRCPDGYAARFVRSTDGWRTIMEIEFVVGE